MDTSPGAGTGRLEELLAALDEYRPARQRILEVLRLQESNRDPFAEFSEHLVAAVLEGVLATNRVQKGYDLTVAGEKVQVRYLANSGVVWVNEHHVRFEPDVDRYALVLYEAFVPTAILVFPPVLDAVCAALGKRHPHQDKQLQLTRRNFWAIRDSPDTFRAFGMQIWLPPFGSSAQPGSAAQLPAADLLAVDRPAARTPPAGST